MNKISMYYFCFSHRLLRLHQSDIDEERRMARLLKVLLGISCNDKKFEKSNVLIAIEITHLLAIFPILGLYNGILFMLY